MMTLPALREQYRLHGLTIHSVCAERVRKRLLYVDRLFAYLGPLKHAGELADCLNEATLTRYLLDYARQYSLGSRREMHSCLRCFLRYAYEERFFSRDLSPLVPTVQWQPGSRLPRALPDECIKALEDSIDRSSPGGRRDAAIICLLSTYGVRAIQVRCLRLNHIDWQNERIHFPPAKRGRPVEQHLTVKAGNRLADYITNGRPETPFSEVFLTLTTGTPLACSTSLTGIIRRRLRQARIQVPEGVSHGTHGLRHAFAVRMSGRVPFKDVVDMLGHRDPSSTLIYAKTDLQALQQAALPWPGGSS
jgi:integrase